MTIIRKSSHEINSVTYDLAKGMFEMQGVPQDRPLSQKRLGKHKRKIREGKFHTAHWVRVLCLEDGQKYRADGKTTSKAFLDIFEEDGKLPQTGNIKPKVLLEEYQVDTREELGVLYAQFNSIESARTHKDLVKAVVASNDELHDLPVKNGSTILGGICFAKWGSGYSREYDQDDKLSSFKGNEEFVRWADSLIGNGHNPDRNMLRRVAVVAAMYKTWNADRESAEVFWQRVIDGRGHDASLGDRQLQKRLLSLKFDASSGAKISHKDKFSSDEIHVMCLRAYNSWVRGVPTDLRRPGKNSVVPPVERKAG